MAPHAAFELSEKWSFGVAGEFRTYNDFEDLNQILLHSNVKYKLTNNVSFSLGMSYMGTYRQNMRDEFRPWQAVAGRFMTDLGDVLLQEKLEERIYPGFSQKFDLRSRTLAGFSMPLSDKDKVRFEVSDEIFFDFNNTDWGAKTYLNQNRLKLGFKFLRVLPVDLQVSYMNQHLFNHNAVDVNTHLIVLYAFFKWKRQDHL